MFAGITKKRLELEKSVIAVITELQQFVKILMSSEDYDTLQRNFNRIIEIEADFESSVSLFNEKLVNRYNLPFYWQDIYAVVQCMEKLNNHLHIYFNKFIVYKNTVSFVALLTVEHNILENIKSFMNDYLKNKKYISELFKNNRYELKNFMREYIQVVNTTMFDAFSHKGVYEIGEIFERIYDENENIHSFLNKIFISVNL